MAREQTYTAKLPTAFYFSASWEAPVTIDRIQRSAAVLNAAVKEGFTELAKGLGIGLLACITAIPLAVVLLTERWEARARRRADREGFVWLWNDLGRSGRWRVPL